MKNSTLQRTSVSNSGNLNGTISNRPTFEAKPSKVVFKDFEPFKTYKQIITFRNNDDFYQRKIQVVPLQSRFFVVERKSQNTGNKVATGLGVQYEVSFSPESTHDYSCDLRVIVEGDGDFLVPIMAIGDRAVLDFPSDIKFENTPVKYESEQVFCVHNVGKCSTSFVMLAQSPFIVEPAEVTNLEVGCNFQMYVKFFPTEKPLNGYSSQIEVKYDNGEVGIINVTGEVQDVNVRLSTREIQMTPTFITERSQQVLKIVNKSDIKVNYNWRSFSTVEDERKNRTRKIAQLSQELFDETSPEFRV